MLHGSVAGTSHGLIGDFASLYVMYETVQPLLARPTGPGGLTPMSALLPLFLAALSEAGLNIYTSPGGELVNLTVC